LSCTAFKKQCPNISQSHLLFGIGPVFRELRYALADKGKALLLVHVPVQHVKLVVGEAVNDAFEGGDGEVVAAGVEEEAAIVVLWRVLDGGLRDDHVATAEAVERAQLAQGL
jgi:hypothetical protein